MPFYAEFYALFNKILRYFCHDLAISTGFAAVNIWTSNIWQYFMRMRRVNGTVNLNS